MQKNIFLYLVLLLNLWGCIKPYDARLENYEDLLVVDALITNENKPCFVTLSRTYLSQDDEAVMISGATVSIKDNLGNEENLAETSPGIYSTSSSSFIGTVGKKYILYIRTIEGEEYQSDTSEMFPVPSIDSITYIIDNEFYNNGSLEYEGIRLFCHASDPGKICDYYRWTYDETRRFHIPYPVRFEFIDETTILPIPFEKYYCWKYNSSDEIIIQSQAELSNTNIKKPVHFISPQYSERINDGYSVLVKQYSVSRREYTFWNDLKSSTETTGNIFEQQPFSITGNIKNMHDPEEKVLGYFQVSAVETKRFNIGIQEVRSLGLRIENYFGSCELIEMSLDSFAVLTEIQDPTYTEMYNYYISRGYFFTEPLTLNNVIIGLKFSMHRCVDCSLSGDPVKPDFWDDIDFFLN